MEFLLSEGIKINIKLRPLPWAFKGAGEIRISALGVHQHKFKIPVGLKEQDQAALGVHQNKYETSAIALGLFKTDS
jgi:hypothetical protein